MSKRHLLPFLLLVATALPTGAAQASWGTNPYQHCSMGENHHCYAMAVDRINTYATIGLEETRASTVYGCAEGAFVTNEMWVTPESRDNGWIEAGQLVGRGYCDQLPHLFFAELSPTNPNVFHIEVSSLPTYSHQYNMYAISDIPEKNGHWHTYYRIPNESSVWSEGPTYGGGWSAKMTGQQSGMEAATETEPIYEGAEQTAYTNKSIIPYEGWVNWNGAELYAEEGNTCIQQLGSAPGNASVAAC